MENKLLEKIKKMPKVELHMHLDGSIPISYVINKYNLKKEEIEKYMIADDKCKNLNDYLEKFDYPISIMQTKEQLQEITIALLEELKRQNVIYMEIRFAPQFHTNKGMSQEDVIKAVIEAKSKVDIKSNFILCIMRGKDNIKSNYETVDLAKKYLGKGVCAVDLAGAEAVFKTKDYKEIFEYVKKLKIPFTIHAGEADGVESIKSAIDFGAKRIGHGVRVVESENLMREVKNNNITLEVCPTSNIQTCICNSYSTHPLETLYKFGILTTINTDNMTVSNTSLENEYLNILKYTNLTNNDLINMNKNSIRAAFLSEKEKRELLKLYWEE